MFFLPLFDNNPTGRTPFISWLILAICVIMFLWQTGLSASDEYELFLGFGVVPALLFGHQVLPEGLAAVSPYISIFTSMFLHGGWLHLGSNMLYLWIFADNVYLQLLLVVLVPGLLAFIFGWLAFRSRVTGVYLSILTQAMTLALSLYLFQNDSGLRGNNGLSGLQNIPHIEELGQPTLSIWFFWFSSMYLVSYQTRTTFRK